MRQLLILFIFSMTTLMVNAQIEVPAPSPMCKLEQKVGLTDITIEYSRPGAKNRRVFGKLVPYGEMWRTGANASTKVTFSRDVEVGGELLEKGTYALYAIPGEIDWEIIFYKDLKHWGVPKEYNEEEEAVRVVVESEELPWTIETFTMDIGNIRDASASLILSWESTMVSVKIGVPTEVEVEKSIASVLSGPGARDYYVAARYYFANEKDLEQARDWAEKANEMDAKFWQLRLESLIHAKMEDLDEAIRTAKESMAMAEEAGNNNYVKMNKASIEEWLALKMEEKEEMRMDEPAQGGAEDE